MSICLFFPLLRPSETARFPRRSGSTSDRRRTRLLAQAPACPFPRRRSSHCMRHVTQKTSGSRSRTLTTPLFDAIHSLAHPSGKATLSLIARSYARRNMRRVILQWARQCRAYATSKIVRHTQPPVLPIPAPAECFGHVHIDIVGPFSPDQGFRYLLTVIGRTARWPEAVPIADTMAETILQTFIGSWISRFGIPSTVTSDRGAQFTSATWQESLKRLGIHVSTMTSYHPQMNGVVERFHRTLKTLSGAQSARANHGRDRSHGCCSGSATRPRLTRRPQRQRWFSGLPNAFPAYAFKASNR